jgi:hypothetical protein
MWRMHKAAHDGSMFTNPALAETLVAEHIRDLETTARNLHAVKSHGLLRRLRRSRWGPPSSTIHTTTTHHTAERARRAATDRTSVAAGEPSLERKAA